MTPQDRALCVTRFEVIDDTGRVLVCRPCEIELSFQDADRTLKVFVRGNVVRLAVPFPAAPQTVTISRDALMRYVEWHGGIHDDGCPEDDTCDCSWQPVNDAINEALKEHP